MKKVILTGGTSKRFGSNKAEAKINGKSLLEILATDLDELIIVGPTTSVKAIYVREEPIGGGPVSAIGAAMTVVDTELVAIFATDMPFAPKILDELEEKHFSGLSFLSCEKDLNDALGYTGNKSWREMIEEVKMLKLISGEDEYGISPKAKTKKG